MAEFGFVSMSIYVSDSDAISLSVSVAMFVTVSFSGRVNVYPHFRDRVWNHGVSLSVAVHVHSIQFTKSFVQPSLVEFPLREGLHSSLFISKSGNICFCEQVCF